MDRKKITTSRGFTLVEILIVVVILAILAALVVPQFSDAARVSRENVLKEDLRYLRSQIMVYEAQHNGVAPGYPNGDTAQAPDAATFLAQMSQKTNASGQVGASYPLGPYLSRMPDNPLNGLNTIRVVDAWPNAAAGTHGWVDMPGALRIAADAVGADGDGRPYFEY